MNITKSMNSKTKSNNRQSFYILSTSCERRSFFKNALRCAMLAGGGSALNTQFSLIGSALAADAKYSGLTDHKALVCVYLAGGCDTNQLVVPGNPDTFSRYQQARGELALEGQEVELRGDGGNRVGFNASLSGLAQLYIQGDLAIVQNIGNLHAPVTRSDFMSNRPWLPGNLFRHHEQYALWANASSHNAEQSYDTGWAGRMADLLLDTNVPEEMTQLTSFDNDSLWMSGQDVRPLTISIDQINSIDNQSASASPQELARLRTLETIVRLPRDHALKQHVGSTISRAQLEHNAVTELFAEESQYDPSVEPAQSTLARKLQQVARMIQLHENLHRPRQIFFIQHNGWDTHTHQRVRMSSLMRELDQALSGFQRTLREQGLDDSVTTFTASEFGRTLTPSSSGSGHGWGAHVFVMGAAVAGGQLHGSAPSYQVGAEDDAGDLGRFIPTTSTSHLGASIARWFGLDRSDVSEIFPDLANLDSLPPLALFNV